MVHLLRVVAVLALIALFAGPARAQEPSKPDAGAVEDAGVANTPQPLDAGAPSPRVLGLREQADNINALMRGQLDVAIAPATLFSVDLDDPQAIAVELRRLRSVLAAADQPLEDVGDAGVDDAKDASASEPLDGGGADATPDAGSMVAEVEPVLWQARLALDRATSSFLALDRESRNKKLADHAKRQKDATEEAKRDREAELRKRSAEEQQRKALQAAKHAATEGIRRLESEKARLLGIESRLSSAEQKQIEESKQLKERADVRLAWQRDVDGHIEQIRKREIETKVLDRFYTRLVSFLATSHGQLSTALEVFSSGASEVEGLGNDPLSELGPELDTKDVVALRGKLQRVVAELRLAEAKLRKKRAELLVGEVQALSKGRLALLPYLSDAKRDQLFTFRETGRTQARAELEQIKLVLRYHQVAAFKWAGDFDFDRYDRATRMRFYWKAFQWLVVLVVFGWWYRRADRVLLEWLERVRDSRRKQPGRERFIGFLRRVRRPAEWLALFLLLAALLPKQFGQYLEVQLVGTLLIWVLGEAMVVNAIDALATRQQRGPKKTEEIAALRLRSLRLVGRVVVVFGLTLSLSSQLAGKGTIYHWAMAICFYFAAPLLVIVVVYWWKALIFERINIRRRHSSLTGWVVAHEDSWLSFLAALVGGVYLLARGINHFVRTYLGGFDLVRRLLAYSFRREISKKEDEAAAKQRFHPLDSAASKLLDPKTLATELVPSVADPQVKEVMTCIDAPGGGVFAIVGERGSGKSTMLERIADSCNARLVRCPAGGVKAFMSELRKVLGLPDDASAETIRDHINALSDDSAILVDDAHHLVRPVIGGIDDFDRLLTLARDSSITTCTWVFALDSVIWQFFKRARGTRPLFDDVIKLEPWSEDNIAKLLRGRSRDAALEPVFDLLLSDLPEHADEIEQADARARAETNYYRLLWDYANGNPAIALHFWRESLKMDDDERHVVRLFRPPDTADIDRLPDDALFVLRAVVQLELATAADVVAGTMLPIDRVADSLRYALNRGYLELSQGRYCLHWSWFRAITNLLQRRHLLVEGE